MIDEKSCGIILFITPGVDEGESSSIGSRKYLILHYWEGHWDLPKGHTEPNESEEETAKRELLEETGISSITFVPDFKTHISYTYNRNGRPSKKEVIFFLAQTESEKVRLSDEHVGFEWLTFDDAMKKLTYKNTKNILQDAETHLRTI